MYSINKLFNCGIFQGANRKKHYFEGWYFKHVDKSEKEILAVIPGISYEDSREKAHAFIQIIDGRTSKTYYIRYRIEDFWFSKNRFEIKIGDNSFRDQGIDLNIKDREIELTGRLSYTQSIRWPTSAISPNSMGWYGYIPVMECYHGVLSLHHYIHGQLILNGKEISFDGGLGYMEKDWGTSFPSSWVWLQSNHFDRDNISLMMSVAKIPWHGRSFVGLITGLWFDNALYRFTTYTNANIDYLRINELGASIGISDRQYELTIKAKKGTSGALQAPVKGAMTGSVMESISGIAAIKLNDKKTGRVLLDTQARCCGMEVAGKTQELVSRP